MGCNCTEIEKNCMGCQECEQCNQKDCSCPIKDFSTDCILYTGDTLSCSGIPTNTIGTDLIEQLDAYICEKFAFLQDFFGIVNVGTGAGVYKGTNLEGKKELRSLVSADEETAIFTQNAEEISLEVGKPSLQLIGTTLTQLITVGGQDFVVNSVDIETSDIILSSLGFSEITGVLTATLSDATEIPVDLSYLDNHVVNASFNTVTKNFTINLKDGSTVVTSLAGLEAPVQEQANVLEENNAEPSFIQNKNPNKSVVLGAGGNYNVGNSDNNYIIEIDNGANNVTINVGNVTPTSNFFVGFVQKGTGTVTFTNYDVKPLDLTDVIYGQGHIAALEVIASTKYINGTFVKA